MSDRLIVYDFESAADYGLSTVGDKIVVCDFRNGDLRFLEIDMNTHEMNLKVDDQESEVVCEDGCLDLDPDGGRWEGGVKDGLPCGYGCLYSSEGRIVYQGYMMNGKKICYGKEFYDDINMVKYCGSFLNGKRFGKGTLYNRNGDVEYDGFWRDNKPRSTEFDGRFMDNYNETVEIANNSLNSPDNLMLKYFFSNLRQLTIGSDCFEKAENFCLEGLNELENIVIGRRSFTLTKSPDIIFFCHERAGVFQVKNCPKLKTIQIGGYSFGDYHMFDLDNLPSLQSVHIGDFCFFETFGVDFSGKCLKRIFSTDLPRLESLQFDSFSFCKCIKASFEGNRMED